MANSKAAGRSQLWTWLFAGSLLSLSVAVFVLWVRDVPSLGSALRVPWWTLVPVFYLAERFVVHLEIRRDAHSFTLSEIPLIAGLFFVSPVGLVASQVLGLFLALAQRRQPVQKMMFNIANLALSTSLALWIFRAIAGTGVPGDPLTWGAVFAATIACSLFEITMIIIVMSIARAGIDVRTMSRNLVLGLVATGINTSLALVGAALLWADPRSGWLMAAPSIALLIAYRSYRSQLEKRKNLEHLHESSRVMRDSLEIESAVMQVLSRARIVFRSSISEVVLVGATPTDPALSATLGEDDKLQLWLAFDQALAAELTIAGVSSGCRVISSLDQGAIPGYLSGRGIRDAMVVPLIGDGDPIGMMFVGNRLGDVSKFTVDDLRLLETFANNATTSLENARLIDRLRTESAEKNHQAMHDPLTDLPNRTLFHDRLEQSILNAKRDISSVAVMIMDLDRFKEVNDTLGHHQGDLLLMEVARRLRHTLREIDTAARLSGDEFAILLPGIDGPEALSRVAEKILGSFREPFALDDMSLDMGASIGIAIYPDHGVDPHTLLQRADVAMYLAKSGQTGSEIYAKDRDLNTTLRLALVGELRKAIEAEDLLVYYQPKMELATGKIKGVEALVRWDHPTQGFMSPDDFIPLAEQTGLIRGLTMHVLKTALKQCRTWRDSGVDLSVAVNLSTRNLLDQRLPEDVAEILGHIGVPAGRLVLEITESSIMDSPRALEVLTGLSQLGVRVAIDDFGTGYSSLAYLSRLPVHEIKIDKSFVLEMMNDDNDAVIVNSTVDLGRNLGLTVVAEGMETEAARRQLQSWGCEMGQGYLISPPLSAKGFSEWITSAPVLETLIPFPDKADEVQNVA